MRNHTIAWTLLLAAAGGCQNQGMSWNPFASKAASEDPFTIVLGVFTGADHVALSNRELQTTQQATGWQGLGVHHADDRSTLYWGAYDRAEDAQKDLATARGWTSQGARPFATALIMRRPGDDLGPPEYNLANASGAYTIVIAEFFNTNDRDLTITNRKQLAVNVCLDLRQKGKEAFYYHGPVKSLVTIGNFPESAFRSVTKDNTVHTEPDDPRIRQVYKEWPKLAVNGYEQVIYVRNPQTGKEQKRSTETYTLPIPNKKEAMPGATPTRLGQP